MVSFSLELFITQSKFKNLGFWYLWHLRNQITAESQQEPIYIQRNATDLTQAYIRSY